MAPFGQINACGESLKDCFGFAVMLSFSTPMTEVRAIEEVAGITQSVRIQRLRSVGVRIFS
jgi:hypothetical protein